MISNQKIVLFLKRHSTNILVWFIGIALLILMSYFSNPRPDFIEENEILTSGDLWAFYISLACIALTSWIIPFSRRLEKCEQKLEETSKREKVLHLRVEALEKEFKLVSFEAEIICNHVLGRKGKP